MVIHQGLVGGLALIQGQNLQVWKWSGVWMVSLWSYSPSFDGKEKRHDVKSNRTRWWFQIFLFLPLLGEDSHFDQYFSDGLKPPTRGVLIGFFKICQIFFHLVSTRGPSVKGFHGSTTNKKTVRKATRVQFSKLISCSFQN